jgi:hypothetical protein
MALAGIIPGRVLDTIERRTTLMLLHCGIEQ